MKRVSFGTLSMVLVGVLLVWAGTSHADEVFSGSSGDLKAAADFSLSGTTLTVTLTNTSTADVLDPTDVLTGVFFDTTGTLTPVSASLNGSTVYYGTITNAGDGWGLGTGVSANGENTAISATGAVTGLGHSNFSGASNALDGLAYGILSEGFNVSTTLANTGVTGHGPLIQDSVEFTLTVPTGFTLSELGSTVVFQYGTDLSATHFDGTVPEPSSLVFLLGSGLLGLAGYGRRKLFRK